MDQSEGVTDVFLFFRVLTGPFSRQHAAWGVPLEAGFIPVLRRGCEPWNRENWERLIHVIHVNGKCGLKVSSILDLG